MLPGMGLVLCNRRINPIKKCLLLLGFMPWLYHWTCYEAIIVTQDSQLGKTDHEEVLLPSLLPDGLLSLLLRLSRTTCLGVVLLLRDWAFLHINHLLRKCSICQSYGDIFFSNCVFLLDNSSLCQIDKNKTHNTNRKHRAITKCVNCLRCTDTFYEYFSDFIILL